MASDQALANSPAEPPTLRFGESGHGLDGLQLFDGVAHDKLEAILASCPVLHVAAGSRIDASDGGSRLYVVLRGALDVSAANLHDGSERDTVRVLPGECVGELSVLDGEANSDVIRALQDSELLVIGAPTLWRLIDESNGVARNLLRLLSFRIRAAGAMLRRREKLGEFYRQLSMVDSLTGLHNRAWLNQQLPLLVDGAQQSGQPLSAIMIDIDHFKRFNDEHGHQAGDRALQAVSKAIVSALRPTDFAVRYGGEELLVILPATAHDGAAVAAQRLCDQVRQTRVSSDRQRPLPQVTASFGIACLAAGQNVDGLVANADAALYRAKEAGRDRIAW